MADPPCPLPRVPCPLISTCQISPNSEQDQKQNCQQVKQPMGFSVPVSDQLEQGVTDEAKRNSFRDAEGDGHNDEGQERWYRFSVVIPADVPNPRHHERTD